MFAADSRQRAIAFCDLLLKTAHFDEAHWVDVAINSPTLCQSEYAFNSLRRASALAVHYGMDDMALWINTLI